MRIKINFSNLTAIEVSNSYIVIAHFISLNSPPQDLKTTLKTTSTLALENQDTFEKVNEQITLIQANTDNLEVRKPQINSVMALFVISDPARKSVMVSVYRDIIKGK